MVPSQLPRLRKTSAGPVGEDTDPDNLSKHCPSPKLDVEANPLLRLQSRGFLDCNQHSGQTMRVSYNGYYLSFPS